MENFTDILQAFEPISLKEMDNVKLLNRSDTKFILNTDMLAEILEDVKDKYRVLSTNGKRTNSYKTLYFDTQDFSSYTTHHNGKLNRIKIRFREYIDSGLIYLEIKFKNNKGKTIKSRVKNPTIENILSPNSKAFIEANSFYKADDIKPVLWNGFTRITLVHKTKKERATIDLNLSFSSYNGEIKKELPHLIIVEIKQERMSVDSDFIKALKKKQIRQSSMSKYCIGTVLTNKTVKANKFKEHILKINKLKNDRGIIA